MYHFSGFEQAATGIQSLRNLCQQISGTIACTFAVKSSLNVDCEKSCHLCDHHLPMSSLRNLMQCEDVGSVAWFVHECMERVDSHTG
jgi:hypothetical protein